MELLAEHNRRVRQKQRKAPKYVPMKHSMKDVRAWEKKAGKKWVEGRIEEINDTIARANVIDITKLSNDGKIIFGATVSLKNLDNDENVTYKIVGKDEADLKDGLIYFKSPIGKGLIGKNKSDLLEIKTPSGIKNFEVIDVQYI